VPPTSRPPSGCPWSGWGPQGRTNGDFVLQCWTGGVRSYGLSLRACVLSWLVQGVTTRGPAETLPEAIVQCYSP
jgi:hypothetical protein